MAESKKKNPSRRKRKQSMDLASMFQAVSGSLSEHQASLNQADSYNHDHGDNMVQIFGVINEAIAAKNGKKPAEQLAYASELLEQRAQSGSARIYASGLSQAAQQIKGKSLTTGNLSMLLQSLLGGQVVSGTPSNAPEDLLGSLLAGVTGSQSTSSQSGLDLGNLLTAGKTFVNSQQQGESGVQSLIKAFVSATQAGQKPHRAQSGELVASSIIQLLGKQSSR